MRRKKNVVPRIVHTPPAQLINTAKLLAGLTKLLKDTDSTFTNTNFQFNGLTVGRIVYNAGLESYVIEWAR